MDFHLIRLLFLHRAHTGYGYTQIRSLIGLVHGRMYIGSETYCYFTKVLASLHYVVNFVQCHNRGRVLVFPNLPTFMVFIAEWPGILQGIIH